MPGKSKDQQIETDRVVNVASVPHRSPFRYPGGKTWLVPRVRQWLRSLPSRPASFVEPFAGGGIVGLSAVFEDLAGSSVLVELDDGIGRSSLPDNPAQPHAARRHHGPRSHAHEARRK
jgi:hypothetical protein